MSPLWLLVRKDLLVLRRSPVLLAVLVAYPLVIAVLIGLMAGYANAKPRVGLVDLDGLPPTLVVAGKTFHVHRTIDTVSRSVKLVRLSPDEAERQLRSGRVVAVITVPRGFLERLEGLAVRPYLQLETGSGGISPRVRQQMQALVYNLNRRLQTAFIEVDLLYVDLLLRGGRGEVLGTRFDVLGLDAAARVVAGLPAGPRRDALAEFVQDARQALSLTHSAIRATANPIELREVTQAGRTWALSAQVQAYGIALTITFLALLLAAGALAAERDENTIGRLARGLAGPGVLVGAKIAVAALVAGALGFLVALTFGIVIEVGDVTGGEPWERLPLVLVGLALGGASVAAIGAWLGTLARETRTASLIGVLFVLPVVFLGLIPREIVPPAGWVSDAFPFVHAVRFFASALHDASPWASLAREGAWLLGLAAVFAVLARSGARRLST